MLTKRGKGDAVAATVEKFLRDRKIDRLSLVLYPFLSIHRSLRKRGYERVREKNLIVKMT